MDRRSFFGYVSGLFGGIYGAFLPSGRVKVPEVGVPRRSGSKYIKSFCSCNEQRIMPWNGRVVLCCPHTAPYYVDSDGGIEFIDLEIPEGGVYVSQDVPGVPYSLGQRCDKCVIGREIKRRYELLYYPPLVVHDDGGVERMRFPEYTDEKIGEFIEEHCGSCWQTFTSGLGGCEWTGYSNGFKEL